MKVLIIGAGVIGSFNAARLTQAGVDVTLLARGSRLADLEANAVDSAARVGVRHVVKLSTAGVAQESDSGAAQPRQYPLHKASEKHLEQSGAMVEVMQHTSTGAAACVTQTVAEVTGHPARSYDDFARDFATVFSDG